MISLATPEFWQMYKALPAEIQSLADKGYALWRANPAHPSVRFKPVDAKRQIYSARVGIHYRALAHKEGDTVIWMWIGHHSAYDRLI